MSSRPSSADSLFGSMYGGRLSTIASLSDAGARPMMPITERLTSAVADLADLPVLADLADLLSKMIG